jgi:hypothetical protein
MKKTNQKLAESVLRKYIQKEIRRMMEADETTDDQNAEAGQEGDQEEAPKEEPKKKEPEQAPEEEAGLNDDFQAGLDQFVQKLKTSTESVDHEDLVEIVGQLIDVFVSSNEGRLNILRAVKTNIVQ